MSQLRVVLYVARDAKNAAKHPTEKPPQQRTIPIKMSILLRLRLIRAKKERAKVPISNIRYERENTITDFVCIKSTISPYYG